MNWKTGLQLRDISEAVRIEAVCKICGHMHYIDIKALLKQPELQFIYIDELEGMSVCRARDCRGEVRLALAFEGETEGFLGGLA